MTKQFSIIPLFLAVALLVLFLACDQSKQQAERHAYELRLKFTQDSLWVCAQSNKPVHSEAEIDQLKDKYNGFWSYPKKYSASRIKLMAKMDAFRVHTKVGKIYVDEFSGEEIKPDTKEVVLTLKEYMAPSNEKNSVQKIAKGYKSSTNRLAHQLQIKYGWESDDCITVASGKIRIGMNKQMVLAAWGRAADINKTMTSYGVHEQWVYGYSYTRNYVYFEDGVVTTIQN